MSTLFNMLIEHTYFSIYFSGICIIHSSQHPRIGQPIEKTKKNVFFKGRQNFLCYLQSNRLSLFNLLLSASNFALQLHGIKVSQLNKYKIKYEREKRKRQYKMKNGVRIDKFNG